jgi:RecJ-like exonuclease
MKELCEALDMDYFEVDMSNLIFSNDPTILRNEALKRNSEKVQCPKCQVEGNRPNMMRWHFEKCKTILKNCEQCGKIIPRQGTKDFCYKNKKYCERKCYMESKKGIVFLEMTVEMREKLSVARKKYLDNVKNNNTQIK